MSEGFPLLTTKKMAWKSIVTELLWFLQGNTNIKYLVDNDCHIWDGDAYKNYYNRFINENKGAHPNTKEVFIQKIKIEDGFAEKWGDLGPIYGRMWRFFGQMVVLIITFILKKNSSTKLKQMMGLLISGVN